MTDAERIYMTARHQTDLTIANKLTRPKRDVFGLMQRYVERHAERRGNVVVMGSLTFANAEPERDNTLRFRVRWYEWLMVAPEDRAALADLDPRGLGDVVFAVPLGAGWELRVP